MCLQDYSRTSVSYPCFVASYATRRETVGILVSPSNRPELAHPHSLNLKIMRRAMEPISSIEPGLPRWWALGRRFDAALDSEQDWESGRSSRRPGPKAGSQIEVQIPSFCGMNHPKSWFWLSFCLWTHSWWTLWLGQTGRWSKDIDWIAGKRFSNKETIFLKLMQ